MEVCSDKVECKVAAKRMWQAAFIDGHNCLPKALPHAVSHVSYQGQPFSPGNSFRTIHMDKSYAEQNAKEKHPEHLVLFVKDKVEELDQETLTIKLEMVEGGLLGLLLKHAKHSAHIEEGATPNTCVVHWSFKYEALSEKHQALIPATLKEHVSRGYKQLEEYLLSHDDYKVE
eukprot:c11208_g1_i1 orf=124-642(+)